MSDEATITATMDLWGIDRPEALQRLSRIPDDTEDDAYARFLVDLFEHHKHNYTAWERGFWRDNAALAHSSSPRWSPNQKRSIRMLMASYKHLYTPAVRRFKI